MRWTVRSGDVLDEPADVLVCSANPWLALSGGVGGELLRRYGEAVQRPLREELERRGVRHVSRGEVVVTMPEGVPYRAVLHAVAVDGFYQSSAATVREVVERCLRIAASLGAKRIALAALATGYGRLSLREFAEGVQGIRGFAPVEEVVVRMRHEEQARELASLLEAEEK